jgi:hypothetical protein
LTSTFGIQGQLFLPLFRPVKADLINKGTEGRIARLAKNEDTIKLKLGFFLLKNPGPSQLELGILRSEQIHEELEFFNSWKEHRLKAYQL